jgi:hypothetical protein
MSRAWGRVGLAEDPMRAFSRKETDIRISQGANAGVVFQLAVTVSGAPVSDVLYIK